MEHTRLDSQPDLLHGRQGTFHAGWLDLADMLFDDGLLGLRENQESRHQLLPWADLRGQMRIEKKLLP